MCSSGLLGGLMGGALLSGLFGGGKQKEQAQPAVSAPQITPDANSPIGNPSGSGTAQKKAAALNGMGASIQTSGMGLLGTPQTTNNRTLLG